MKRHLSLRFILIIIVSLITFLVGATFIAQSNFNKITELNLHQYLDMITLDYESGLTPVEIVDKYDSLSEQFRITFMDSSGIVIVDSSATELENHLSRPEFNNLGETFIRTSQTIQKKMMYLATRLDEDTFLRVSIPLNSIIPFINDFVVLSIGIGILIVILAFFLLASLMKTVLNPLVHLKTSLHQVYSGNYQDMMLLDKYDEINSLIYEINEINKLISSTIAKLNEENLKSDFLLENMSQGICVINKNKQVILTNKAIQNIFHYDDQIHYLKDYHFLIRDVIIQQTIEQVFEKKNSSTIVVEVKNNYYSVTATYIDQNWNGNPATVVMIQNITDLKNIENIKKDFFINASHELKSPLTSILGSSELITSGMVTDIDTIRDLVKRIYEEANSMSKLVMDMLNLSKYEGNIARVSREPIALHELVTSVVDRLKSQIEAKHIDIKLQLEEIIFHANVEHMSQIMKNIIENSIQYSNDDGWVHITLTKQADNIIFSVEDNGIGIAKSEQSRIFERFYRVDKARSKETGGTGLGLSIVKHIVLMYSGSIKLDSVEGSGTKMTIIIPDKNVK